MGRVGQNGYGSEFLSGGGELGALMRAHDWASTPVGPPDQWPQSLKTAVRIMLTSRQPIWIGWGAELIYLYNDPYKAIIGGKHPWALGKPTRIVWEEIWGDIGPMLATAMKGDEGTYVEEQLLIMERNGYPEETYYTFSYSPIPDDDGSAGGIICANTDDTQRVIGERQLALLTELSRKTAEARTWQMACESSADALASNRHDLPFALIYLAESDGTSFSLAAASGIEPGHPAAPDTIEPYDGTPIWPVSDALGTHQPVLVNDLAARFASDLPAGNWPKAPAQAAIFPISASGEMGRSGTLVVGLNPFRLFDEGYRSFLSLVAGQIGTAIANAEAYEEERRRAEALAEIDRAKTAFFSNVSHEFRTPLTLLLGPLEEILAKPEGGVIPDNRALVDVAHRNGLRLLRLVNTLLDFSRIEAGRAQASYEPVDLAALTADLASNFRAACERAGLSLAVDCPALAVPVHVDRDMWEKIVLNLLSNAFKYTIKGGIAVSLHPVDDDRVELRVVDTGVGIPESELPRVFDRFHRIEGQQGRTHEGSGIGLALVQELVKLHGGSISVASEKGRGTTFTVSIPLGTAHLPADRIKARPPATSTATGATAFVEEAMRWLPDTPRHPRFDLAAQPIAPSGAAGAHILLADDNADMRDYVRRLLEQLGHEVEAVADGEAALDAARRVRPDLILTDVMMPKLDGFGLVRALREDPDLRDVPVIMLSARAGEEARIEGLDAGADDYLVKPFAARELVARVSANLTTTQVRREVAQALRESEARFRNMADHAPVMMWVTDASGGCTYLNRAWYEFTGQSEAEALGSGWLEATHPDDRAEAERTFLEANAKREAFRLEYRLRRHDGVYRWSIDAASPRFGAQGEFLGYIGSVIDIDDRRAMEEEARAREAHVRLLLDSTQEAFYAVDRDGTTTLCNAAFLRLLGFAREEEAIGRKLHDVIHHSHPDGSRYVKENCPIYRCARDGTPAQVTGEFFYRLDGSRIPVEYRVSPIVYGGKSRGAICTFVDISERLNAENALQAESRRLETLNRTGAALSGELDLERVVQMVTDAGVALTDAAFGAFFYNVLDDRGESYMLYTLSGVDAAAFEGFPMPRNTAVFAPTFEGEGIVRSDDITADPRYGKNAPNRGMPKGHLPVRSYLAVPVTSRSGEVIGGLFFGHPEPGRFSEHHEALMAGIAGQAAVAIDNARLYQSAQRENDERRRTEERLRDLLETLDLGAFMTRDMDGAIRFWSAGSEQLYGWSQAEAIGRSAHELLQTVFPVPFSEIEATLLRSGEWVGDLEQRRKDGATIVVSARKVLRRDADGRPAALLESLTDVTAQRRAEAALRELNDTLEQRVTEEVAERARAEEALRQAQKMEAVGQLTGGVAHDFNNLLTIITGNMDMALRSLDTEDEKRVRRAISNALKGAERAASLTQRLLAFSRRQPLSPKPIDVDKLVAGMSDLLNRALGETIRLETVTTPGLWRTEADPNQLENALLNLAVNARDAMPDGGKLTIETANARLDESYSAAHAEVAPGNYVVIAVSDTGKGMSKQTLARVFEPFFTTKDVGKGTGLGLSQVYGFVKQSGGHVKIYSEEGDGTTVKIYLPRLMSAISAEEEEADVAVAGHKAETILVVEDDEDVRAYTVEILRELGYRVLEAHDGPAALRFLERDDLVVDLLFTDVVMPGMSGRELVEEARKRRSDLKVLYTSGYTRNAIVHNGRLDPGVEMIAKPFTYQSLSAKVRQLLDAGSTGRLLLVEDEATVRMFAAEALTATGFAVEEAANAAEAMNKIRAAGGRYDAVVLDAGLPDKRGELLVAELRAMHVDLPILLTSGESISALSERFADDRCTGVIAKPYNSQKLQDALKALGVKCRRYAS